MDRNKTYSLIIGVPTINSADYLYDSLGRYKKEIALLDDNIKLELAICINGPEEEGAM